MANTNKYVDKLFELSFSYMTLSSDFKRNYVAYKINETDEGNYKLYMRDKTGLDKVLSDLFLLQNDIENDKKKVENTLVTLDKEIKNEKKINEKVKKKYGALNNSDLGAQQFALDKHEEYGYEITSLAFYLIGLGLMFLAYKRGKI